MKRRHGGIAALLVLGRAWRLEGDRRYARQAQRELVAAAGYRDWNPGHYLDTAEMTASVALGYDWFHDALSPKARKKVRNAIVRKGAAHGPVLLP